MFREAIEGNLLEVKRVIDSRIVDINFRDAFSHRTVLFHACKRNHRDVILYLLAAGADPNEEKGVDPKSVASREIASLMKEFGMAKVFFFFFPTLSLFS
jgi:ankyrin repeat protein